jgi:hypothetical protein
MTTAGYCIHGGASKEKLVTGDAMWIVPKALKRPCQDTLQAVLPSWPDRNETYSKQWFLWVWALYIGFA